MKKILFPLLVLTGWLTVPQTKACWKFVPLETRMTGAEYVVVGKIDRIVDGIKRQTRTYNVGAIKVSQVLKGPKTLKEVRLMWPSKANKARISTDILFNKGQHGVWILYPDKEHHDIHWASYPSDYHSLKNLPKVKEKMKALGAINWSKPAGGLQLSAIVEATPMRKTFKTVNGKREESISASASTYVLLRNNGKAATHVVNYPADKAFTYKLTGPDGVDVPIYQPNRFGGKVMKHHYLPVAPNALTTVGYGMRLPTLTQKGKYTLELNYANKRKGIKEVKGPVWAGQLAGKVSFKVK